MILATTLIAGFTMLLLQQAVEERRRAHRNFDTQFGTPDKWFPSPKRPSKYKPHPVYRVIEKA